MGWELSNPLAPPDVGVRVIATAAMRDLPPSTPVRYSVVSLSSLSVYQVRTSEKLCLNSGILQVCIAGGYSACSLLWLWAMSRMQSCQGYGCVCCIKRCESSGSWNLGYMLRVVVVKCEGKGCAHTSECLLVSLEKGMDRMACSDCIRGRDALTACTVFNTVGVCSCDRISCSVAGIVYGRTCCDQCDGRCS